MADQDRGKGAARQRAAGQHAREMKNRYAGRTIAAIAVLLLTMLVAIALLGLGWWALLVEVLVVLALMLLDRFADPLVDRWRRGAVGEEHVGSIIETMRGDGWLAIHDISTGRGNVDHVMIGPAGIFTLETKSHSGRIRIDGLDERMLRQAYAESKFIEELSGQKTHALLVFSRAYLTPAVKNRRGVTVLPARMLAGHLGRRPNVLSADEVLVLHQRLLTTFASVAR